VTTITTASGPAFLDAAKGVQAAGAGQAQIEQDGVEGLCVEKPVGVFGGIGHVGRESQRLRNFAAGLAD
jgi:hypothetical protein